MKIFLKYLWELILTISFSVTIAGTYLASIVAMSNAGISERLISVYALCGIIFIVYLSGKIWVYLFPKNDK